MFFVFDNMNSGTHKTPFEPLRISEEEVCWHMRGILRCYTAEIVLLAALYYPKDLLFFILLLCLEGSLFPVCACQVHRAKISYVWEVGAACENSFSLLISLASKHSIAIITQVVLMNCIVVDSIIYSVGSALIKPECIYFVTPPFPCLAQKEWVEEEATVFSLETLLEWFNHVCCRCQSRPAGVRWVPFHRLTW